MCRLSVVVPMYNEQDALPHLIERLRSVCDDLDLPYEVLAVDDGSDDLTPALLEKARRDWPELRVMRLRMNAGHQAALSAGLRAARGCQVVSIDADLQDPPEAIPLMLRAAIDHDADVVYGVRTDRSTDTRFKRWSAMLYYRIIGAVTGGNVRSQSGDFRLMSRTLVDAVNALPETGRVVRLVVPALGFPAATVEYRRERRVAGHSKYRLRDMVQLSLDSITSVSQAPLRLATYTGLLGGVLAVLVGLATVVAHGAGQTLPGWTSTVAIVSAFSALQLLCLGILGEYIGRTYAYLQRRPTYVVDYDSAGVVTPSSEDTGFTPATKMEEPKLRL